MLFQLEQLDKTFSNTTTVHQFHADSLFKVTVPVKRQLRAFHHGHIGANKAPTRCLGAHRFESCQD